MHSRRSKRAAARAGAPAFFRVGQYDAAVCCLRVSATAGVRLLPTVTSRCAVSEAVGAKLVIGAAVTANLERVHAGS